MKCIVALVTVGLLAAPACSAECTSPVNFAVQHQVRELLGDDIILHPEKYTLKQRGYTLYLIRTKYKPWARHLPEGCVKAIWLEYLTTIKEGINDVPADGLSDAEEADKIEPTLPKPPK